MTILPRSTAALVTPIAVALTHVVMASATVPRATAAGPPMNLIPRAPGKSARTQRNGMPRRLLGRLHLGVDAGGGGRAAACVSVISPDLVALEILRLWLLVDGASVEWRGRHQLVVHGAAIELVGDRAHELGVRVHELTDRVVSQDPKAKAS